MADDMKAQVTIALNDLLTAPLKDLLDALKSISDQVKKNSAAIRNLTESHEQADGRIQDLTGQLEEMREEQELVAESAREAEEAEKSFQARLEKLQSVGEGMIKFGAALAAPAAGLSVLATKAMNAYAEVQKGEVRFKNTFEASDNPEADKATMQEAVALAERLGVSLPGSTSDMLDMFSALREQGVTMERVLHGTGEAAANFATLMGVGFEQSAVMMSKFSEALDVPAEQATDLVDILQRLKGASGLTVDDLYGTFSYLGSTLKTLKVGGKDAAKEISALLTIMGGAGIEGSRAGTGLAGAMSAMANVKDKINSKGFQEKFGKEFAVNGIELSFFDKSGQFIGTKQMFMELQKLKKLDDQKQLQVLTELFGEASARPMAALVAAGEKGYNEAVKKMEVQKDTQTKIKEIMGTISMSWESLQGTIDTLTATVGKHINQTFGKDGIAGIINKVNDFISENIIGWINAHPKEVQEIIKSFAEIPKLLTPLWDKFKDIGAWLKDPQTGQWIEDSNERLTGILKTVAKLIGAGALVGPVIAAAGSGLVAVAGTLGTITNSIKGLSEAGKLIANSALGKWGKSFGSWISSGPIGRFIRWIGSVSGRLSRFFNGTLGRMAGRLGGFFSRSMPWLTRLSGVLGRVPLLSRVVTSVAGGILRANAAGLAFTIILELIKRYWGDIKAFFVGFADGFVGKFGDIGTAIERVKIAFEPVLDMISQAIDWLLGKPSEDPAVNSLANGYAMGDTFGRFLELVLEIIENVGYLAKAFLDMFADIGKDLATTCNWLEKAYNWVLGILQSWGLFKNSYNPDNIFGPEAQKFQGLDSEQIKKGSQEAQRQAHLQREADNKSNSTVNNDYSKTAYNVTINTPSFDSRQVDRFILRREHEQNRRRLGNAPAYGTA